MKNSATSPDATAPGRFKIGSESETFRNASKPTLSLPWLYTPTLAELQWFSRAVHAGRAWKHVEKLITYRKEHQK